MNKEKLAQIIVESQLNTKNLNESIQTIVETISNNISLLANLDPDTALDVINQINDQIGPIKDAKKHNDEIMQDSVKSIQDKFPENLVIEE